MKDLKADIKYKIKKSIFAPVAYGWEHLKLWVQLLKLDTSIRIFNKQPIFYIHIPKTGGMSVRTALKNVINFYVISHNTVDKSWMHTKQYYERYPSAFYFTFVRNPWDRLVSSFFFLRNGGMNEWDKSFGEKYLKDLSFNDFVLTYIKNRVPEVINYIHIKPMSYWILNDSNNLIPNFIGRTESLEDDLNVLLKDLGAPSIKLSRTNTSRHKPYYSYYTNKTMQIVADFYEQDIKLFNYEFR